MIKQKPLPLDLPATEILPLQLVILQLMKPLLVKRIEKQRRLLLKRLLLLLPLPPLLQSWPNKRKTEK